MESLARPGSADKSAGAEIPHAPSQRGTDAPPFPEATPAVPIPLPGGPTDDAREDTTRGKVLRLMASVRRPLTGREILTHALKTSAAHVREVMDAMADDGLVTVTEAYHPNARGRRSRSYQLAGADQAGVEVEGGAP